MLRRHRAATLGKTLAEAPPPPTRRSASRGIPIANPNATSLPPSQSSLPNASSAASTAKSGDDFNGALHCAKAFGIATLLVGVGATTTIWGVKRYMGVETVSVSVVLSECTPTDCAILGLRRKSSQTGCAQRYWTGCHSCQPGYTGHQRPMTKPP